VSAHLQGVCTPISLKLQTPIFKSQGPKSTYTSNILQSATRNPQSLTFMHLPIFQLLNFSIILIVLIFLVKYLYDMFFGENYEPPAWEKARKERQFSRELLKAARNYPDKVRLYNFWLQIERINKDKVSGDFAELGVYKGESARLLHLMAPDRILHLFDTFEGFTGTDLQPETGEAATYSTNNFADTSLNKVLKKIGGDQGKLKIHAGYFPQSAAGLEETTFALVNLDADLYNPTKAGLEYFYPRLSPGGIIFIHDYNHKWEGLVKAVDEFAATIPEQLILLPDLDTTVMILKNKL
jgi:O-methyltransferase